MENNTFDENQKCIRVEKVHDTASVSTIDDAGLEAQIYIDLVIEDYDSDSLEA
jgi:hypothetical protein